uniref:NPC1 like intracellular cholesterol transporter 1 n=1 Tax=Chelonoidis abingdonii TaxID=106734 RepID=A0A8C0H578_CHEAB
APMNWLGWCLWHWSSSKNSCCGHRFLACPSPTHLAGCQDTTSTSEEAVPQLTQARTHICLLLYPDGGPAVAGISQVSVTAAPPARDVAASTAERHLQPQPEASFIVTAFQPIPIGTAAVAWWVRASKPSFDDQSYDSARAGSLQMSGYTHALPGRASPAHRSPHPLPAPPSSGQPNGVLFVCCLLFCLLTVLFGAFLVWGASPDPSRPAARAAAPEGQMTRSERLSQATTASWGMFRRWGTWLASHPVSALLVGWSLSQTHQTVWSSGLARQRPAEREFYDQNLWHFFRPTVILTAKGGPITPMSLLLGRKNFSGILSMAVLLDLLDLQSGCKDQALVREGRQDVTLKECLYAPLDPSSCRTSAAAVNGCASTSRTRHSPGDDGQPDTGGQMGMVDGKPLPLDHFELPELCSPLSFKDITNLQLSCMADYGAPVFPFLAVGGYTGEDYSEAQALILTFSLNNYPRSDLRYAWVLLWEQRFLQVVGEFQQTHAHTYTIAYMAERSLEDEINRTTAEDIPIFAISYLVIFLYIALALGEYSSCRRILVDSKVTLGLGGILVVLGAVFSSMGFYAYVGLPSSLVIIEVVPFLVLAVGADNIFIFVGSHLCSKRRPGCAL